MFYLRHAPIPPLIISPSGLHHHKMIAIMKHSTIHHLFTQKSILSTRPMQVIIFKTWYGPVCPALQPVHGCPNSDSWSLEQIPETARVTTPGHPIRHLSNNLRHASYNAWLDMAANNPGLHLTPVSNSSALLCISMIRRLMPASIVAHDMILTVSSNSGCAV